MGVFDSIKEKVGGACENNKLVIGIVILLIVLAVGYYLYTQGYLDDVLPAGEGETAKKEESAATKKTEIKESYIPLIKEIMRLQGGGTS